MKRMRMWCFDMAGVKRSAFIIFAILIVTTLSIGLGVSEAVAKDKVWKLQIQSFTVPGKYNCMWEVPEKFIELVKKHTNGRVKCSFHPAGEFVGAREIWTAVAGGSIEGGTTLDVYQGGTHPEFNFDVGAIWSIDEYFKVMHAGALDILNKQATAENVRIIGTFPLMNYYAVSMKREQVKTLEDLKGKKIRGMGGAANIFLKEAGAGSVTLPMSEVPPALQTGVVAGIHTGCAGLYAMRLWDVAPYFTATHSGNFGFFFLINESIYQEFPDDIKAGIKTAQIELEEFYKQWDAKFWKEIKQDVEKKGIKWYDLTPEESLRWKKLLTKASVSWVMKRNPDRGKELFQIVEKVSGRKVLQ
jgi:TRAP-type C4-dicarboxylate transport system substrate-binding protein